MMPRRRASSARYLYTSIICCQVQQNVSPDNTAQCLIWFSLSPRSARTELFASIFKNITYCRRLMFLLELRFSGYKLIFQNYFGKTKPQMLDSKRQGPWKVPLLWIATQLLNFLMVWYRWIIKHLWALAPSSIKSPSRTLQRPPLCSAKRKSLTDAVFLNRQRR